MIVYFADRKFNILGMATTSLDKGLMIEADRTSEAVENGVVTFECDIGFDVETRAAVRKMCKAGNFLLRHNKFGGEFYTILDSESDTDRCVYQLYCENAGMDLINATACAYAADQAYPAAHYFNRWIDGTGFKIGVNEISDLKRKLEWSGESTVTQRLASVATQFDNAEISYSFTIKNMRVTDLYVNIWRKRGKSVNSQLRLDRDIDKLVEKTSVSELATALYVKGGTPDGESEPITLSGYSYDDGDFFIDASGRVVSRSAQNKWGKTWGVENVICKTFSFETTSKPELCTRAIEELKKLREPVVTYEAEILQLPDDIAVGDRIDIVDDAGETYVSSRILKIETSVTQQKTTVSLGEFIRKDSGISERIDEIVEKFSNLILPQGSGSNLTLTVTSSAGAVFTDSLVETTLTAHVYKDGEELDDISGVGEIKWYKDGVQVGVGKTCAISGVKSANVIAQLEG